MKNTFVSFFAENLGKHPTYAPENDEKWKNIHKNQAEFL